MVGRNWKRVFDNLAIGSQDNRMTNEWIFDIEWHKPVICIPRKIKDSSRCDYSNKNEYFVSGLLNSDYLYVQK